MAGYYGLHYFMLWCVVVASGGAGQSDGGICGVISHIEALQAQLAKAEQEAAASGSVLVPQLQSIASQLQLLNTNVTQLGKCDKITCPEGYQACGDMCYRLRGGTWCDEDGSRFTVPSTQKHIDCVLALTSDTGLPVYTNYENRNGVTFTSYYNNSVVAPAELVGTPGPNGDGSERHVIIHRNSGLLVRSQWLGSSGQDQVIVCEKPPLE